MAVILWIESIGGGRVGEGEGRWGTVGGLKQTFKHKVMAVLYHQYTGDPDWHISQGRPGLPLESVWDPMQSH